MKKTYPRLTDLISESTIEEKRSKDKINFKQKKET